MYLHFNEYCPHSINGTVAGVSEDSCNLEGCIDISDVTLKVRQFNPIVFEVENDNGESLGVVYLHHLTP